jgi:hypothetical protein
VGVGVGFGAFLQSGVVKPSRQSVFSFQRLRKSLTKVSSAFCWFCDASSCLIVVRRLVARLLRRLRDLVDLEDVPAELRLDGPVELPFFAEKIASSNAFSCWPLATAGSLPPCALEASSIEYSWPPLERRRRPRARLRLVRLRLGLGQDDREVARSGCAKRALFLL